MDCNYSQYCGGCSLLNTDYPKQLEFKTSNVKSLFSFAGCEVDNCVGNYYPYKYRNKVHLAFKYFKKKLLIGFFEEGSTRVVDITSCHLFGDWLNKLIICLREFVGKFKIKVLDEMGDGILRYAHARFIDGNLQLTLVATTNNFSGRSWLLNRLQKDFKNVSLYININNRTDRAIFGEKFVFVGGEKYLTFNMCGVKCSIEPMSFLQINLPIAEKMYRKAFELLEVNEKTTILDLYSGIGITSIYFAKNCNKVVSIEETPTSVSNAKYMAKLNGVKNIVHLQGKCENLINQIKKENEDFVVFVDPARAGLEEKVVETLKTLLPRKIVYMSCNPETCARDIKIFIKDNLYSVVSITPWDMFPNTNHVETIVCLERR